MKIWVVKEAIMVKGFWKDYNEGYFSSRKNAELAIREYLEEDYPEEVINIAYEQRFEDDCGFVMTMPGVGGLPASKYDVSVGELDSGL